MDQNKIADLIREGRIDAALKLLEELRPQVDSAHKIEIDLITARFNTSQKDLMLNQISYEEGSRETARITHALLQLLNKIYTKQDEKLPTKESAKAIVEGLGAAFIFANESNPALKLREKNEIVRLIYPFFIDYPGLVQELVDTDRQAIICAIAHKMKLAPNIEELKTLQRIAPNATSDFTKGHIVNALAEFVYSGQLRFGDDTIIFETLNLLKIEADIPLQKNIERVEIALQYFLGQIK